MAILYQLRCVNQHTFEGWFPSIEQFDSQKEQGMLQCPMCGILKVDRDIMSPRLGKAKKEKNNIFQILRISLCKDLKLR